MTQTEKDRPSLAPVDSDAASAVRARHRATRLQENSAGGSGDRLGKRTGESFAWDPKDKSKPNPQRPLGGG